MGVRAGVRCCGEAMAGGRGRAISLAWVKWCGTSCDFEATWWVCWETRYARREVTLVETWVEG